MAGRRPGRCVLRPGPSRSSPPPRAAATSCPAREAAREPSAIPSGAWQQPSRPRLPATCSWWQPGSTREPGRSSGAARPASRSSGAARARAPPSSTPRGTGARPGQGISASGSHDVWFEGLTIQNAIHGAVFHDAARIVVRHCHIRRVDYGITATRNYSGPQKVDHSGHLHLLRLFPSQPP